MEQTGLADGCFRASLVYDRLIQRCSSRSMVQSSVIAFRAAVVSIRILVGGLLPRG